jgi:DNA-binding transcriptional ArsR family regulator
LLETYGLDSLAAEVGRAEWDKVIACFMETTRDAFHAFSLGDAELAKRAVDKKETFEKLASRLRSHLLVGETEYRKNSAVMDFFALTRRFLNAVLEIVRGDGLVEPAQAEDGNWRRTGDHLGQK